MDKNQNQNFNGDIGIEGGMVFNATFNNISVISHNVVSSTSPEQDSNS